MLYSIARNSNNSNNYNMVLSLKDFAKSQTLSPQMVTATTDIIYKSNPNGLWLDFPTSAKPIEETRDDCEDHGDSRRDSKQPKEERWSSRLVQQPQQLLLKEHFHCGFIPSHQAGDRDRASAASSTSSTMDTAPMPAVVTVGPMDDWKNDDDSLLSFDDENDDSSFATAPDATFETFDDLSVLTGEENDNDAKLSLAMQDTLLLDFLVEFCSKPSQD